MKNLYTDFLGKFQGGGNLFLRTFVLILFLSPLSPCNFTISAQQRTITLSGIVLDETGNPMAGVTVVDHKNPNTGTTSNQRGSYQIIVSRQCDSLRFSFIGYKSQTVAVRAATLVRMQPDEQAIGEVVVTGIYTRKAESYTGAATTVTKNELLRVGNQNALQSLKNLDPTIYIPDNMTMGSDPNTMPTISMRGTTSFPNTTGSTLKSNYQNQPNQPLFILDGFETSIETVMDMDMNRIESMTILKDAAAKALYGSKAANGVIVIETKRLGGNQPRISYTGNITITAPDLTSYDLCNALEKLQVELNEGVYTSTTNSRPEQQIQLTQQYNARKKLALEGLDTYWLSKPLRTGVGHKHNLNIELGNDESVRAFIDFTYNTDQGVMKGSDRTTISGDVNLSYRLKQKFLFRNIMSVLSNKSSDSPYGAFSEYAKMNPFWKATDSEGNILRWAETGSSSLTDIPNPMYNATIGTSLTSSYLKFTNNFYAEWRMHESLKATLRIGISQQRDDADSFYPAAHSMFRKYTSATDILRRGRYTLENGKSSTVSGDFNFAYNKSIGKHNIFANAGYFISETKYSIYSHTAEGFANDQKADITQARQYAAGERPVGQTNINREASVLFAAAYDYDNRYLLDASYRPSASSLFGTDNRWAHNWAVGIGWNFHNEVFMRDAEWLKQLKIRGSVGVTGNQNFSTNDAIATYEYYKNVVYQNLTGAYLAKMPNPQLKWEQKLEYNIGFDAQTSRLSLSFDYFSADSKNMLTDLSIQTSTGFSSVKDNIGLVRNSGLEAKLSYLLIRRANGFLSLHGNIAYEKNKIIRLSESLRHYNETVKKNAEEAGSPTPILVYEDGGSMNSIWAVPSAGIDPMTGNEIYIKKDGTLTYDYDYNDSVVAGNSQPTYRGNFGFTAEYKGIGLSTTWTFLGGCQMYNYTLVNQVENVDINYNVDRRVLLGRWQTPGQVAQFKRLDDNESTRPTTRFVQDRRELNIASISCYYEFPRKLISKLRMERLRLSFYANNVATFSSIKIERGLTYPFARTMSVSLTATF